MERFERRRWAEFDETLRYARVANKHARCVPGTHLCRHKAERRGGFCNPESD